MEWSFTQVFFALLGWVLAGGIGGIVAIALGEISLTAGGTTEVSSLGVFIAVGAQVGGALIVLAYLSRTRGTGSFATDFGLQLRLGHWWGIPAGAGLQIGAALVTAPLIQLLFPEGPPQQRIAGVTEGTDSAFGAVLILLSLVVLAPLGEELIFRGMLLSRLVRSMAVWWAIAVQAAVFALIHLTDPEAIAAIPGLFLIAVVLGYAAIRTGSLSLPLFLHAGVNLTAALLLLYGEPLLDWLDEMSGLEPAESLIRALF